MVEENGFKLSPALRLFVLKVALEECGFRVPRKLLLPFFFWEYVDEMRKCILCFACISAL